MKSSSRRNSLAAFGILAGVGLVSLTCLLLALWAMNQTYPEARLLSRDGPRYHSTCRWYGCTWTVLSSSLFLTNDEVGQVYTWYWNNRRVWDLQAGRLYLRFAFLQLGAVEQSPTRYRLETEFLVVLRKNQED